MYEMLCTFRVKGVEVNVTFEGATPDVVMRQWQQRADATRLIDSTFSCVNHPIRKKEE